ncbi:MAG TPA: hypothetical protein K8V95_00425 [Staphylococcus arlettae]|nr:hypothetical protein [Staphylococcus arlettae]
MLTSLLLGSMIGTVGYCGKNIYDTIKPKKDISKDEVVIQDNKLISKDNSYNFNELFYNCGLDNKSKDMPQLINYKNMSTVDIFTFKLPAGVSVSKVRTKLEEVADFFEIEEMNIKIQKKNNKMDIIITKNNLFSNEKVIDYYIPKLDKNKLMMPIGHYINKDYLEKFLAVDMSSGDIPHAFIGATTGGGKSNFIISVLLSWVLNYSPKDLEICIMDSQGGADYTTLLYAPHVKNNKCYSDIDEVHEILDDCLIELKERQQKLVNTETKNAVEYRKRIGKMPFKVIIIDEYASFKDTEAKKGERITDKVATIAANGRKVDVHIIIATQDANQNSIDPTIKRVLPLRIGFKCANEQHSKNICEHTGLETLKVKGVGRAYGLPIDDQYVQFRAMLAPSSSKVKSMIKEKYKL